MSVEQYQNFCDRVAIMPGVEIKDELMSKHTTFRIGECSLFVSPYAEEIPGLLRLKIKLSYDYRKWK